MFMGGLDLCFGRYEAYNYPLKDPSSYLYKNIEKEDEILEKICQKIE